MEINNIMKLLNPILESILKNRYLKKNILNYKYYSDFLLEDRGEIFRKTFKELMDAIKSGKLSDPEIPFYMRALPDKMVDDVLDLSSQGLTKEDILKNFYDNYPEIKDYPELEQSLFKTVHEIDSLPPPIEKDPLKFPSKTPDDVEIEGNVVKKPQPKPSDLDAEPDLKLSGTEKDPNFIPPKASDTSPPSTGAKPSPYNFPAPSPLPYPAPAPYPFRIPLPALSLAKKGDDGGTKQKRFKLNKNEIERGYDEEYPLDVSSNPSLNLNLGLQIQKILGKYAGTYVQQ